MDYAIDHSFASRHSTLSEKRLKAEALHFGVGSVAPEDIHQAAAQREDLLVIAKDGQRIATTKGVLQSEIDMLALAREGRGQCQPFPVDEQAIAHLDDEGKEAVKRTLHNRDWVSGIEGGAGTGKTTLLRTLDRIVEEGHGVPVKAFAQSSSASRGTLQEAGFKNATTLASLYKSEKLQKELKDAVVLVDESSLSGTSDVGQVLEIAKREGARKVIFVGDTKQHGSVEAGDAFRLLKTEAGVQFAELKTIRRQKSAEYRRAVEEISKGTRQGVQKGFDLLDRMGAIVEAGQERHALLVKDYLDAVKEKKSALIIAPTRAEGRALTEEIRAALKADGTLGEGERTFVTRTATSWTDAQKRDVSNYRPDAGMVVEFHQATSGQRVRANRRRATIGGFAKGEVAAVVGREEGRVVLLRQDGSKAFLPDRHTDRFQVFTTREVGVAKGERIRILKNDRSLKINNGDVFTVEGFNQAGDMKLSNGTLLPKHYGQFGMGYVDTSYAAQGKSVDRVFIAAGDSSLPAVNAQQWYVSVSRGKESVKIYVDDKEEIRQAIARSGQRLSAVELVRPESAPREPRRSRLHEMLERNRILRYVRERHDAMVARWRDRGTKRSRDYA